MPMKIQSAIASAALLGVLATSASALTTVTPAADKGSFQLPAPVKIIEPIMVPQSHEGSVVHLAMKIDANGKPSNIRVLGVNDQSAYRRIIVTVSQWEFSPARRDGKAVPSKVELPLEVKGL